MLPSVAALLLAGARLLQKKFRWWCLLWWALCGLSSHQR
jgi:hypothetical protein